MCHTLSIMYVPFADLRDGYSCTIDKHIWREVFASMTQRPARVDPFKNHFQYAGSFHGYNTRFASRKIFENFKCGSSFVPFLSVLSNLVFSICNVRQCIKYYTSWIWKNGHWVTRNWDQQFQTLNSTTSQKRKTKICFIRNLGSYL